MNSRHLVFGTAIAMLALIGAAVAVDCVRLAAQARARVELADQELAKHEQRLVKLLSGSAIVSPEVAAAIDHYQQATGRTARHEAYDKLLAAFRQSMQPTIDPTNALDRKFMDDIAGAINRREVAAPAYDAEMSEYLAYLDGPRGAIASWFTSQDPTK